MTGIAEIVRRVNYFRADFVGRSENGRAFRIPGSAPLRDVKVGSCGVTYPSDSVGNQVVDDRLVPATCNAFCADHLLELVCGCSAVHAVRCSQSVTVVDLAALSFRCSVEGVRERLRRTCNPGCAAHPMTWVHKNIFYGRPSPPPTSMFDGVLIQDRELSADAAESIFVVDFMADKYFGGVRILIGMTAFAWTLVCAWINGRWPSRRSATGRALPALASGSAGA